MTQHTKKQQEHIEQIELFLKATRKKSDFQRIQCVLLRYKFGMTSQQVAEITHFKNGTVRQIWSRYINHGLESLLCKEKGGRRNYHMSFEEEKLFLSPFFSQADQDGKMPVSELKELYEKRIGLRVPKSTIYRLLKRHGWNKQTTQYKPPETKDTDDKKGDLNNYWIKGCTQAILPKKAGNISQEWLNTTLNSMSGNSPGNTPPIKSQY